MGEIITDIRLIGVRISPKTTWLFVQLTGESGLKGVGEATLTGNHFPDHQEDLPFHFKGIVAFYDPPKQNIRSVLEEFYAAGISVKIVTGDYATTTTAIARQIGFKGFY